MKILGFNVSKISAERLSNEEFDELKVNTNIDVPEITKAELDIFGGKDELLNVKFEYVVEYVPNMAKISFAGSLLIALDPKTAKDVLKEWKDKKMPEDFKVNLFNIILRRFNVKALQLEEDMGLPVHFPMPRLTSNKPSEQDNKDKKK